MKRTTLKEIEDYIVSVGVESGDLLMVHADLRIFGMIEGMGSGLVELLNNIVGVQGGIITPSFSFTFPRDFDIKKTPSTTGALSNLFSKHSSVNRVPDGMTSYYIIGEQSKVLIDQWSHSSYGIGSIPDQFLSFGGKVLQVGTDILSFVHYVEELVGVPYRSIKRFSGNIINNSDSFHSYTDFYARVKPVTKVIPDPIRTSFYTGIKNTIQVGGEVIRLFGARDYVEYSRLILEENNLILIEE